MSAELWVAIAGLSSALLVLCATGFFLLIVAIRDSGREIREEIREMRRELRAEIRAEAKERRADTQRLLEALHRRRLNDVGAISFPVGGDD